MQGIGAITIILGKLFICGATSCICYIIMATDEKYKHLYSTLLPILLIIVASFVIGTMFTSIYGASSDAILQCYCIDEEVHEKMNK